MGTDGESFREVLTGGAGTHRAQIFGTMSIDRRRRVRRTYAMRSLRDTRYKLIVNHDHDARFPSPFITREAGYGGMYQSWRRLAARDPSVAECVALYEHRPPLELYDLEADPHELRDLARLPEHAAMLERLRGELGDWMRRVDDPLAGEQRA